MTGRYPNLFLVGMPKAATTTLYAALQANPNLFFCHELKEPNYFHYQGRSAAFRLGQRIPLMPEQYRAQAYLSLYRRWRDQPWCVDASTDYLSAPGVAERIHAARPDARIVAILRDPVERAFSQYLMKRRDGIVTESFAEALRRERADTIEGPLPWTSDYTFVRQSLTASSLQRYLSLFGPDQVRLYLFEELRDEFDLVLDDLAAFLGVPPLDASGVEPRNAYAQDRFARLTRTIQAYRRSRLRGAVNRLVPRSIRGRALTLFNRARLKPAPRPRIPEATRDELRAILEPDYRRALTLARSARMTRVARTSGQGA